MVSINSSKVYCKFNKGLYKQYIRNVLIVAKCIVNVKNAVKSDVKIESINSSKVYCK